jgi:hypothetical protein
LSFHYFLCRQKKWMLLLHLILKKFECGILLSDCCKYDAQWLNFLLRIECFCCAAQAPERAFFLCKLFLDKQHGHEDTQELIRCWRAAATSMSCSCSKRSSESCTTNTLQLTQCTHWLQRYVFF